RQHLNLMVFLFLLALTVFSVYGAFIGAGRAQLFFNSMPMAVFWCALATLLVIGFLVYASLKKRIALLLIHFGCVLVLAGGMYGSEKGHAVSEFTAAMSGRLMDRLRPSQEDTAASGDYQSFMKGMMTLHEGQISDRVALETEMKTAQLPFSIRLKEASIEYYDEPAIIFYLSEEEYYLIPIEVSETVLPDDRGTVVFNAAYKNFKMTQQDGQMKPSDSPEPGYNPAYELTYFPKDQPPQPFFVFERFGMHAMPGQTFQAEFVPPRMIRDYKSTLQVMDGGELVKEMTIEVNKPLYYGGYHFYQNTFSYDHLGPISGVMVASARGVWVVFGGYGLIFVGLILHFGSKLFGIKIVTNRKNTGGANGD
ncbi:MAG: cytochrome c biogenesis protein ResB, partial [Planctomycetota bacterium]